MSREVPGLMPKVGRCVGQRTIGAKELENRGQRTGSWNPATEAAACDLAEDRPVLVSVMIQHAEAGKTNDGTEDNKRWPTPHAIKSNADKQ